MKTLTAIFGVFILAAVQCTGVAFGDELTLLRRGNTIIDTFGKYCTSNNIFIYCEKLRDGDFQNSISCPFKESIDKSQMLADLRQYCGVSDDSTNETTTTSTFDTTQSDDQADSVVDVPNNANATDVPNTPITDAFVVLDGNNKGVANCEVRKLASTGYDCASSTGDLACRTDADGKCDSTSLAVAYGVFCGNRCKTVKRGGATQPANTTNTYLHRVVMDDSAKTVVDTQAIAKAKQEFLKNMNALHSAYENKLKKLQSKATK